MAMAIVDPEELLSFANTLEQYLTDIEERTGMLSGAFERLGETWRDEKRASFEDTYHHLLNALNAFKENSSEQIPYLRAMAEKINDYQRI